MKEIILRIKQLIDKKGLTPYQLEMALGVSRGVFSKKFTGQFDDFKLSNILKLAEKFPDLDMNWLLKGTDSQNNRESNHIETSNNTFSEITNSINLSKNSENVSNLLKIIERQQTTIDSQLEIIRQLTQKRNTFSNNIAAEGE